MKLLFASLLSLIVIKTAFSQDFFQKINSPLGGYVVALSKDSSNNIYAGTATGGIYRSSDNGDNWAKVNNGLTRFRILSIAYDRNYIFTGTNGSGVFRSSDNGNSWTQVNTGLSGKALTVNAFAADILYLYAGTNAGVYKSTDNGDSWTPTLSLTNTGVSSMAVGNGYLHAATYGGGLYLSGDHGGHWEQANNGLAGTALNINSMIINSSYIFIGTDGDGVYRTTDNGNNWTQVINGLSKVRVFSLTQDGSNIYAGTNAGIYRSSDNGDNWSKLSNGLTSVFGNALMTDANYIFAGTNEGVFRSSNHGDNWTETVKGMSAVNVLKIDAAGNYVFAGTSGGVIRSSDNGNSWRKINNGLSFIRIYSLILNDNVLFIGTNGGGVYRSSDNGDNWTQVVNGLTNLFANTLASGGGFIYTGTNAGIFRSSDNGNNWTQINNGLSNTGVLSLAAGSNYIFAGTNGGVFRSSDNGNNWEKVNNGLTSLEIDAIIINNNNVFAGINGTGVFRSTDNGNNWTQVNNGLTNLNLTALTKGGSDIYVATDGGGVYRSADNGDNWSQVNGGLLTLHLTTINTGHTGSLYAVTFDPTVNNGNGIYRSVNPVSASIIVTSPKQGDTWQVGTSQTVSWTSANFSGNVNIKLSTDGGNSFPVILASNTQNDGSESVAVPDKPSTQSRIKIEFANDTTVFGLNQGDFSIAAKASITVSAPQAGVNWTIGSKQTITWSGSNISGNLNIKLSLDSGVTFPITLVSNTTNDGTEEITVPDNPSNACRIRIESVSDTSINGLNPGIFTISSKPSISVKLPAAGANWTVGSSQTVSWTSVGVSGNVNIKLSTDGGKTFTLPLASDTPNDSSEVVTVPDNPSTTCRIRIESVADTSINAMNPGNFTITNKPTITVTAPPAGANWPSGSTQIVTWTSFNVAGNVNILLSTNGGQTYPIVLKGNTPNDSSESVVVPNNPSAQCRIKVDFVSDTTIKGINPGNFTISTKASIAVTAPLAQSSWTIGSKQTVKWTSTNLSGNVNIKLSTDGGNNFPIVLAPNVSSAGSQDITVPDNPSSLCRIKVESVIDTTVFGLSPGNFTITNKPSLSVTAPQAGANWTIGSSQTINWTNFNLTDNVNIKLSTDGGKTFPAALAANISNDGSEAITVPDKPSAACRILVESVNDTSIKGLNPGDFTITSKPTISVTSPQTGTNWAVGSSQTVTWTNSNVTGNVNIILSTDGGNTFPIILLSSVQNNGSAVVKVPDNLSSICRIKIESVSDTTIFGLNPGNFSIVAKPSITISAPNAGAQWKVGSAATIMWVPVNVTGNVNIKLSIDGGTTFPILLAENSANDGNETITVPDNPSSACRVRIESVVDTSIFALSPGNFSILASSNVTVTITSPQTGTNWLSGTAQVISWTSSANIGNVNIKLSTDGGKAFPVILASNTPNDGNETVTVPNITSLDCKIKIESASDSTISSVSNSFSIINYPAQIPVNSNVSFGDINNINNYKIVGLPGTGSIPAVINGEFRYDWRIFWDKGTDQNFLVDSSSFSFSPGMAFWILSKNPLKISQQVNAVQIDNKDLSYSIPLHRGWNLISNPFDKSVKWQSVVTLNKLPQNQLLYAWNGTGKYTNPADMLPYEGYYYNNDSANFLTSLKIPYQSSPVFLSKTNNQKEFPIDKSNFLMLSVNGNAGSRSEVYIGIDPEAKNGYDQKDYYAAPGHFQKTGINLIKAELRERDKYLYIEQRPAINEGQKYELEIKADPGHPIELKASGLENFGNYNVLLLDEKTKNLFDLKKNPRFELNLAHQYNSFSLFIGTDEYISKIKQGIPPLSYELYQNYPNPFNPATTIRFSLAGADKVTLKIYDILGKLVTTLVDNQSYEAGSYEVQFNGSGLSSGIYIVKMDSQNYTMQKKMVLLK